ncbi:MAG: NAD(P)-dependent oxidoreductase [Bdellovibrionota bacterium]
MRFSSLLITGSSGFVGQALCPALQACGAKLHGLDTVPGGKALASRAVGSILDKKLVKQCLDGRDGIIHLAAAHKDFGVRASEYYEINVEGTRTLLEAASEHGVKTFVFFSSVAVYSPSNSRNPIDEKGETKPLSDYGKSKLAAEQEVLKWGAAAPDRRALIIRPTNIFGPGNLHNLYRLIRTLDKGHFVRVGKLNEVKSIVYIGNVVAATIHLLLRPELQHHTFNLVDEPSVSSWELIHQICSSGNFKLPRLSIPLTVAFPFGKLLDGLAVATGKDFPITGKRIKKLNTPSHFSSAYLHKEGFSAPYSLEQGIANTVQWYLQNSVGESKAA